jgi:hypothetical protein
MFAQALIATSIVVSIKPKEKGHQLVLVSGALPFRGALNRIGNDGSKIPLAKGFLQPR